jgi:hypothetical protein
MTFNRLSLLIAAASVASLVGTTAAPAAEMDILTAVVQPGGKLLRSSGALSSTRIGKGHYNVMFNRNIRQCTFIASGSGFKVGLLPNSIANATPLASDASVINVGMAAISDGTSIDSSFHLVVFCPK